MGKYLEPLDDFVVLEPITESNVTSGGIFIPESGKQRATRGRVVAVGRGRVTVNGVIVEPQVNVGDEVIFSEYSGNDVNIVDDKYKVIRENDIFAIVREKK